MSSAKPRISFNYNRIYVIQSLPQADRRTGEELHDDTIYYKLLESKLLSSQLWDVKNSSELFSALQEISERAKNRGEIPILHLELHGTKDGFLLSDGSNYPWSEVADLFSEINVSCGNNLFITMAVCEGIHLASIIKPENRSPFWGFVAPEGTIKASEIVDRFPRFYELILSGENGDEAFIFLNKTPLSSNTVFRFFTSEQTFLEAFNKFCTDPEDKKRLLNMVLDGVKSSDGYKSMSREQRRQKLASVEKSMPKSMEKVFYDMKKHFFMEDLYPENKARFIVNFDDMKKGYKIKYQYIIRTDV